VERLVELWKTLPPETQATISALVEQIAAMVK